MWMSFLYAMLMGIALLYVPGYLFFRGFCLSRLMAACCAPLYAVCAYASLPIVYYELGISCSLLTVATPAFLVSLVAFCLGRLYGARRSARPLRPLGPDGLPPLHIMGRRVPCDVAFALLYVCVAALVCAVVWWRVMPATNALNQRLDNLTHVNLARSFLESGKWSSLHASLNMASPTHMRPTPGPGKFYPSAWNCLVVLVCLASGADLMVCVNAVVTLLTVVLFPLGMYVLLRTLLRGQTLALACGAVAITGFANWPWTYVYTGPLFPNLLGMALQGSAIALFIHLVDELPNIRRLLALAVTALVSLIALALAHPSTIFASYLVVACYGGSRIHLLHGGRWAMARMAGYAVLVVGIWVLCYQVPALQATIGYVENERTDLPVVLGDLLGMQFDIDAMQMGMVLLSAIGCVCVARRKDLRWLLIVVAFFALGYVAVRADWWFVKHWIGGLWYSDSRRMHANLVVSLMPVAAAGLATALSAIVLGVRFRKPPISVRAATLATLAILVYLPSFWLPGLGVFVQMPLGCASQKLETRYHETIYHPDEMAFVDEVVATIPHGALVINCPMDGSAWAYGFNGLNVYYRHIWYGTLSPEAALIRERLCDYGRERTVREAVDRTGATYVLLLDKGMPFEDGDWLWQVDEGLMSLWRGVCDVDDDTPGFTTVLSRGDKMRLYRIDQG